ncbi:MAG: RBBP9/YdeN family alpha/beta hydrolase [Pseudomonadota bacterium]
MSAAIPHPFEAPRAGMLAAARHALPLSTRAALATLLARHRVLIVPGWNNSGPAHWQTLWQREFPALSRVEQQEWAWPDPQQWVTTLDAAIRESRRPTILVAHSLGCIAVARWAASVLAAGHPSWPVAGALLVAPATRWSAMAATSMPIRTSVPGRRGLPCWRGCRATTTERRIATRARHSSRWGAIADLT